MLATRLNTDTKTIINLTQHAYFNLNGDYADSIAEHELAVAAGESHPSKKPICRRRTESGSGTHRLSEAARGEVLASDDRQIEIGRGIDHTLRRDTDGFPPLEASPQARIVRREQHWR